MTTTNWIDLNTMTAEETITGNKLILEKSKRFAYKGAPRETDTFRVTIQSWDGYTFHVSCFETYDDAMNHIRKTVPYFEI